METSRLDPREVFFLMHRETGITSGNSIKQPFKCSFKMKENRLKRVFKAEKQLERHVQSNTDYFQFYNGYTNFTVDKSVICRLQILVLE